MNVTPLFSISRIDELALRDLMKRDATAYIPTLASDRHYPDTVRQLCALLPPHGSNLHGILWEASADNFAPRLADAFGLTKHKASATTPLRTVFAAIRSAQGPAGECVRALLTGSGDCPAALLLRNVVAHRRGSPLPVVDITSTGEPSADIAAVIEAERVYRDAEATADALRMREARAAAKTKPSRKGMTKLRREASKRRATIRAKANKGRATVRARRRFEDPDELSEGISFREQVARGER